jgi:hypothetical protein
MAENGGNSDKAKADDPSVLGSLSSTRPARLGGRAREDEDATGTVPRKAGPAAEAATPEAVEPPARPAAAPKASSARPKAVKPPAKATADSPVAKAQAAAAKAPPAKPKAVKAPAKPKAVKAPAKPKAVKAPAKPKAVKVPAQPAPEPPRPQAVRAGHPTLTDPPAGHPSRTPGGVRAVKGAAKAAGGLASAGLNLGGQALKRVVSKLPRP